MTAKNKVVLWAVVFMFNITGVSAVEHNTNIAQMQAMDKITGRVSSIEIPVNGEVKFGTFSIVVRECKIRSPEEIPESFAFVDVTDRDYDGNELNIFRGWMISSSPALNAVEHPIYDVWLNKCINGKVDKSKLLSADKLAERNEIEQFNAANPDDSNKDPLLIYQEETTVETHYIEPLEEVVIEEVVTPDAVDDFEDVVVEYENGPKSLFDFGKKEEETNVIEDFSIDEEPIDTEVDSFEIIEEDSFLNLDESIAGEYKSEDLFRFSSEE